MAAPADNADSWGFRSVRRFLDAFQPQPEPPDTNSSDVSPSSEASLYFDTSEFDPKSSPSKALGDFDRLYEFCGTPVGRKALDQHDSPELSSSYQETGFTSTSLSSAPEDAPDYTPTKLAVAKVKSIPREESGQLGATLGKAKEVHWRDDIPDQNISKTPMRRVSASIKDVDSEELLRLLKGDSEVHLAARSKHVGRSKRAVNLTPSPITQTTPIFFDSKNLTPVCPLTITEAKARIIIKLRSMELLSPLANPLDAVSRLAGYADDEGIHVFVDLSNIVIGFNNTLKENRGIPQHSYTKQAPISYHSLAFIFERSRGVARRVLAGSHESVADGQRRRRPEYMIEAERSGYEVNILEPVYKARVATSFKKRGGTGNGYATTSGQSSGSDTGSTRRYKVEQCVDEVLQMKMLESLTDYKSENPPTVVLATGDGAEAEFSGGFFKMVVRFLRAGWKVELLSWSCGLSKEYLSPPFLKKWKGRFCIILLDDFAEELLAIYASP